MLPSHETSIHLSPAHLWCTSSSHWTLDHLRQVKHSPKLSLFEHVLLFPPHASLLANHDLYQSYILVRISGEITHLRILLKNKQIRSFHNNWLTNPFMVVLIHIPQTRSECIHIIHKSTNLKDKGIVAVPLYDSWCTSSANQEIYQRKGIFLAWYDIAQYNC